MALPTWLPKDSEVRRKLTASDIRSITGIEELILEQLAEVKALAKEINKKLG